MRRLQSLVSLTNCNLRSLLYHVVLLLIIVDGFAEARAAIGDQAKATFDDIHASFTERLATTRADDEAFFKHIDKAAKTFSSPLENEMVQTAFKEGGKRVEKVFKVGDRVAIVKKDNEKDGTKLIDYWKQWDDVQNEYLELGIDIFGREAFRIETPGQDGGFRKEMALEALEHDSRVDEFEVEIENIGTDSMKKMEACEKVWPAPWYTNSANICRNQLLPREKTGVDFSTLFFE